MAENKKGPAIALTDQERFPLLHDFTLLNALRQDDLAPKFNFQSGDRLDAAHLEKIKHYSFQIQHLKKFWNSNEHPEWINEFLNFCVESVPFYQNKTSRLSDHPTICRDDLRTQPWSFVSAQAELNDLLVYQTSGTTGAALDVLFDPVSQACWLPQLQSLLDTYQISIGEPARKVAIALICNQASTLTYASLSTYLNGAGILKINLNPSEWKSVSDRINYLEKYNPEILTGDPFTFMALLKLQPNISPKAIVSSAMKLSDGMRKELEAYFKVPVLDIYSLTECRMVAVAEGNRHRAIRPDLYLEVFDPDNDKVLPNGERGELVITGGNNPFLPLIRYRTGDFCSLVVENGVPYLENLEARKLISFYSSQLVLINTIDVSRAMTKYALIGFKLHQKLDLTLEFTGWSNDNIADHIRDDLHIIFGALSISITMNKIAPVAAEKVVTYSSDFPS